MSASIRERTATSPMRPPTQTGRPAIVDDSSRRLDSTGSARPDRPVDLPVAATRVTPRDRAAGHWSSFLLHIYPVKVRRRELGFRYSWYLGVISTVLFGSLVVSGIYLMFFYVPSPANGLHQHPDDPDRGAVRAVHPQRAPLVGPPDGARRRRPHGQGLLPGAYKPPREFNWVIGVMLLLLTLLMSFTGYLLPWDQLAFWAVTVGTEMAGYVPFVGDRSRRSCSAGRRSARRRCCGSTCSTSPCCRRH